MALSLPRYGDFEPWRETIAKVGVGGVMPITFTYIEESYTYIPSVRLAMSVLDVRTGNPSHVQSIRPLPEPRGSLAHERERIRWLFYQAQYLYDHEVAEQFKVDGVAVYDPHAKDIHP